MKSDVTALMRERGLDAIMVLGNAEHNPPMYYFTGGGHVTNAVLLVKASEPPMLFCNAMEREEAQKSGLKTVPLRRGPMEELALSPREFFEKHGLMSGRIGVYGQANSSAVLHLAARLREQLPSLVLVGEEQEES